VIGDLQPAKKSPQSPVVFTREEVQVILSQMLWRMRDELHRKS
jgi:hypothetical protein